MDEKIVLIDEGGHDVGAAEKMLVHKKGWLHRAFSVIVFNTNNDMLLQRRADVKYHSGGLWSNTCCGHPRPGEPIAEAAQRRLGEEMGITCPLTELFTFRYRVEFEDNTLIENELDHVFFGRCDELRPRPDPDEVGDWKWMSLRALKRDMEQAPETYTYWFRILVKQPHFQMLFDYQDTD